jgi:3-mercaptopyruvate sulfurtransferase SseA
MRRLSLFIALALLSLAGLTACNSAEKQTSSAGPIAPQASPKVAPTDGIRRITVTELRDLVEKNEAFIVDVRNKEAYDLAHIQGARLIPVADTLNHIGELPKDKLIVTYCS